MLIIVERNHTWCYDTCMYAVYSIFLPRPMSDGGRGFRSGFQDQRRYDMRHEMLTQRVPFCTGVMAKKGTLSQHFVTRVIPPLFQD